MKASISKVRNVGGPSDIYLTDHCLQDSPAMPGSAYLALAIEEVSGSTDKSAYVIRDIDFKSILFLPEDASCNLGIEIIDDERGLSDVIISNLGADPSSVGVSTATMTIERYDRLGAESDRDKIDVTAFQAASHSELNAGAFYDALADRGNQYGPAFRCIENLWLSNGAALASLQPQVHENDVRPGVLHPTIVDAALQAISATHVPNDQQSYLVTGLSHATFAGELSSPKWAYAELVRDDRDHSDQVIGRVVICDEQGRIIAKLEGVGFRYLDYTATKSAVEVPGATLAISATFTAEPVEAPLNFWSKHLQTPVQTKFAPYNQVFQELLDPQSTFSQNKTGLNVALVRFDDWLSGLGTFTSQLQPQERKRAMEGLQVHHLPGDLEIAHLNQYETEYVYKEIFVDRCYMKGGMTLRDGDVVFDIGANIGLFSLFVSQEVRDATIYSFEPSPPSFACLAANAAVYGSNAIVVNCGISDRERTATFTHYENSSVFSSFRADEGRDQAAIRAIVANMVREASGLDGEDLDGSVDELMEGRLESQSYECQLKPVSQVMSEQGVTKIDLLKIDAEGSELDVLNGIEDGDWDKIRQIAIEVHDREGPLVEAVCKRLRDHGFELEIIEEDLLHESGLYNIFAVRSGERSLVAAEPALDVAEEIIDRNINDLCNALEAASARSQAPTLLVTCPPSPLARFDFERAEKRLGEAVAHNSQCHLLPYSEWQHRYPVAQMHDAEADRLGHVPYTPQLFTALGTTVFRHFSATNRSPYKVIVLDCDQTLWRGVCGEDGSNGIAVEGPYRYLQEFAVRQSEAGMLLALCSKNAQEDVDAVFRERTDMPLKSEHVVASRINWQPKSVNIQSMADELGLGLDSFIFIDDNPVECAEVSAALPEVLTLHLPTDPNEIPSFLDHVWAMDRAKVTLEDRDRSNYYRREKQRDAFREAALTLEDFIDGLGLTIDLAAPIESRLPRVSQLTLRTNQFNCTTIRRSEQEIREFIKERNSECLAINVQDRFGDYGLVGVVLYSCDHSKLTVDTFLLSCRVLGRGVEHEILNRLGTIAAKNGLDFVEIPFVPTSKNEPAQTFLQSVAKAFGSVKEDSNILYEIPSDVCAQIKYQPQELIQDPDRTSVSAGSAPRATAHRVDTRQIVNVATELNDVKRIAAAMSAVDNSAKPVSEVALEGSELEQSIAGIWREVLGVDRVGINDRYTELGGTSLRAVQVVARIKRECGINMGLVDLYEYATVSALAAHFGSSDDQREAQPEAEVGRLRGERRKQRLGARRNRRAAQPAGE